MKTEAEFLVGIDLGGTKIEGVVLDASGAIVVRERVATRQERGYDAIVATIAGLVRDLRAAAPGCSRIGLGAPGAISSVTGAVKNSNTTCLNGRRLHDDLAECIGMEVVIENDANCFALAEANAGAGRGASLVFGVILGTGVGGGIVFDGRLLHGRQRIAGEWGHHSIDPQGPHCYCGNRGCVEALISGPAVLRGYRAAGGDAPDMQTIVAAARRGEALAAEHVAAFLDRFGRALANVIDILDPDAVVLGGGLSHVTELYDTGREAVARYVFNDELSTPIVCNELGDSAGVIGAALLARTPGRIS